MIITMNCRNKNALSISTAAGGNRIVIFYFLLSNGRD